MDELKIPDQLPDTQPEFARVEIRDPKIVRGIQAVAEIFDITDVNVFREFIRTACLIEASEFDTTFQIVKIDNAGAENIVKFSDLPDSFSAQESEVEVKPIPMVVPDELRDIFMELCNRHSITVEQAISRSVTFGITMIKDIAQGKFSYICRDANGDSELYLFKTQE